MGIEEQVYGLNGSLAQDQPFYLNMLQSLPGAWTTSAWNVGRVSRTMTSSRMRGIGGRALSGEGHIQGITQTFGPRHLRRLTRGANIDPSAHGPEAHIYSPFNVLSSAGNFLFKKREHSNIPLLGSTVNGYVGRASGALSGKLGIEEGAVPFSAGTLGRIAGMHKITKMSDKAFTKGLGVMESVIKDINPRVYGALPALAGEEVGMAARKIGMASRFGATIEGQISGKFAGYIQGATAHKMGAEAVEQALAHGGSGFFGKGIEAGLEAAKGGKFLAKVAPFAGPALSAFNIAGDIMLVHDLALMAGKGVGAMVKTGMEGLQSMKGSIDKPIMGMGFKDNSVAATSRQRGVMAIQNSQLNARSILGSEASMLASHFG
jgi:hypothetical protein